MTSVRLESVRIVCGAGATQTAKADSVCQTEMSQNPALDITAGGSLSDWSLSD